MSLHLRGKGEKRRGIGGKTGSQQMCKEHLKVENNAKGKQDRNSKLRHLNTLEITRNQLQILDYKQKLPNPQEKVHAEVWVGV